MHISKVTLLNHKSQMEPIDVSIKWPFKWCLVGSSGSGKTNFALEIISQANKLFDQPPSSVIILYKEFQQIYNQFNNFIPTKCYNEEEVDLEGLTKNNQERLLIICDDLYFSNKLQEISEHFLIKARHRNTSWLVLTQSIFNNTSLKNISRNSTHITLFKSVRLNEPHIFFSQLRPKSNKVLQDIYKKATEKSYSYLDIDLSQTCPDKYRYKSNIFDKFVRVYIIMSPSTFKSMYLMSKHDLETNSSRDFKLSLENKDICEGGVNVSIKPVKNRISKDKNIHSENGQTNSASKWQKSAETNYKFGEASGVKDDNEKSNENLKHNLDDSFIDGITHQTDSGGPNKKEAKRTIDYLSDTRSKEDGDYAPIYQPKMKKLIRNRPNFRHSKASAKNVIRLKSQKVDKRIVKKESRPKLKNEQNRNIENIIDPGDRLSDKEDLNSKSTENALQQYPSNQLDHNSDLYDISYNPIDNPIENHTENGKIKHSNDESLENANSRGENDMQDQWIGSLKSKLNDRRVQFKRKRDTVGYRINPDTDDIAKSLVKPSDFKFLNEENSDEYLSKYKLLKKSEQKPYSIKRFKPYK